MYEGRTIRSIQNIVYRMISQIAGILLKFISRTVFIGILGVEYLGINGLFSEILQMLSLADLGFGTAMVFSMYKPLAEKDEYKLAQLLALYRKVYRYIAIGIVCIGLALVPFLQYLVKLDREIPHLRIYYLLYLANTVASYLVVYKTCILTADQKNYLLSRIDTVFNFVSTIGSCIVLYLTRNFLVYLIVQVSFTYARNLYSSHLASKLYPFINRETEKLPKKEASDIFANVRSVFVYKVSKTLVGSTDNTLISVMIGTVAVGLYSNYSMVITNVTMFINIVFSSVTASIGNLIVEANKEKNYAVYKTMQFVSFVLSAFSVSCVYNLIDDLLLVWLGKDFVLDPLIVIAIVCNMYFSVVLMPIWSYREATGLYRQTKYVMVATAVVNLFMSILLGKLIGLAGILFATSIARISTYFWYEPKLLFTQHFAERVTKYYLSIGANILKTIVTASGVSLVFNPFHPQNWAGLAGKTVLVASLSIVLSVLLYVRDKEFKRFVALVKAVLYRRG